MVYQYKIPIKHLMDSSQMYVRLTVSLEPDMKDNCDKHPPKGPSLGCHDDGGRVLLNPAHRQQLYPAVPQVSYYLFVSCQGPEGLPSLVVLLIMQGEECITQQQVSDTWRGDLARLGLGCCQRCSHWARLLCCSFPLFCMLPSFTFEGGLFVLISSMYIFSV